MTIIVTTEGSNFIRTELIKAFDALEITKVEIENEIVNPLIKSIQAERRWVIVSVEEINGLCKRFNKNVDHEQNFRISVGKIMIEHRDGVYRREYVGENVVIKGWHREVIEGIKERKNIPFNKEIGETIFKIGQLIISNENNLYLRIDHERHVT